MVYNLFHVVARYGREMIELRYNDMVASSVILQNTVT